MNDSSVVTTVAGENTNRWQATAYFVAFITLGLVISSVGPTLPGLAENTRSRLSEISVLFTVQSLGLLAGNLFSGRWYDRLPAHPFLLVMVMAIGVALALTPLVSSLAVLAAILFVAGFGAGSIDVGGNTLLVWVYRENVGPRMNALHFFFGFGALLAPIFVAQAIALTGGITAAYWLLAVLVIPTALLFLRVPSPHAPFRSMDAAETRPPWLLVGLLVAMFFLFAGAELSFGGWIYTYALTLDLATATTAGYLTSLFWAALTLGRLLSIPLAVRVRPRYILTADIVGLLVSLALLLLFPQVSWVVWVAAFGFGLSMANVYPMLVVFASRHMHLTGQTTSLFMVGGSLGGMTLPWLIGQRFESTGPQVMVAVILAATLLGAVVFGLFLFAIRRR